MQCSFIYVSVFMLSFSCFLFPVCLLNSYSYYLIWTVKHEWWSVCKQVFWNVLFLFWSLKRSENSVFVINQLPSCAWSFRLLYMLFLPVFCNNLIHNQIGLQCKVYNGKLDLYMLLWICANQSQTLLNLISFSFTTSRCRVKTTYSYRWLTITIANGFINVFSRRVKLFEM